MKKTATTIMALVMVISCMFGLALTSYAANEPSYSVSFSTQEAYQLDVVTMEINIKNNPGLITLRFQVAYDEAVLKLVEVEDAVLLKGWTQPSPTVKSPYILRWSDPVAPTNNSANGTVARLTFKVRDGAAFDKTKVTVEHIESRQFDGAKVNFANASDEFAVVCPHQTKEEKIIKQPTHTEAGEKTVVCSICGETLSTEAIPALGHSFGEWTVTTPATCTAEGIETRTCSCGETETRPIAKTAHTFGEWTITKDYTCTEDGVKERVCSVCGEKETEVLPAAHRLKDAVVTKEPTCTEDGIKEGICSVCGEKTTEAIPALGHSFGEWAVVKEATETEEGLKERVCSVCGEKETETIPVLAPAETTVPATSDKDAPSIPQTSGRSIIGLSVLAVTTLAAGGYLSITRKKHKG